MYIANDYQVNEMKVHINLFVRVLRKSDAMVVDAIRRYNVKFYRALNVKQLQIATAAMLRHFTLFSVWRSIFPLQYHTRFSPKYSKMKEMFENC